MKAERRFPLITIPLLYILFGVLWILVTDQLVEFFSVNTSQMLQWQTAKGWFFVLASTLLIGVLVRRANRQNQQARTALSERESTYRLLFENNPLPMWVYDLETLSFLAVNEAAVDTYGYSRDEFAAMTIVDIRPADDIPRLMTDLAETVRPLNRAGEWRHRRQDGAIFPVEIVSHTITYNGRFARLVISNDISERKQAEKALQDSERSFRRAVTESPFPMIIHAEDGEVLAISHVWTDITGYQPAEIATIGDWTERAYGERRSPVQEGINKLYALNQRVSEGEFAITCADGSRRVWDFSSTPLGPLPDGRRTVISIAMDVTERKLAEQTLREKSEELDGYFTNALDLLCIADTAGHFRRLNREWEATLGYSLSELEGSQFMDLVHLEDRAATQTAVARLSEQERVLNFVNRYRHQDGSYRWIEWRASAVDELIYAAARDITERIQTEERLRLQSTALEAAANAILITDTNGIIEWTNPAFTQLTGYEQDEAIGKNPRSLVWSGKQSPAFYRHLWDTIQNGRVWRGELINRRKNGSLYHEELSITPVPNSQGDITHFVAVKQDITERKQDEAEREALLTQVQAQAEQLMQLMISVPAGVLLLDAEQRILVANPQAEDQISWLANAAIGDTLRHLGSHSLDRLLGLEAEAYTEKFEANGRILILTARPLTAGPLAKGWVLVLRDVTEEHAVEHQLQRHERLAAIGQLAAGIAHDFNNILAVILLYTQLLEQELPPNEAYQARLATITDQADRAARLIQQILDFSRRSVLEQQPIDLLPLLKEETNLLQRILPENIDVSFHYEAGEFIVLADPTRVQQTLINLAVNARDAMPKGGHLRLTLSRRFLEANTPLPLPDISPGDWIVLEVADTGSGMTKSVMKHLFEPFYTTKQPGEGTGLGLAQVYGIIGQHGGHVAVTSKPGKGTTFAIYLPAIAIEQYVALSEKAPTMTFPRGSGELILVVEDGAALRQAIVESLSIWQYRTLEAASGLEAVTLLETHHQEVSAVISDIIMPGMGGEGLLATMQERAWQIPVILLTGQPLDTEVNSLRSRRVHAVLTKPVRARVLGETLAAALNK